MHFDFISVESYSIYLTIFKSTTKKGDYYGENLIKAKTFQICISLIDLCFFPTQMSDKQTNKKLISM